MKPCFRLKAGFFSRDKSPDDDHYRMKRESQMKASVCLSSILCALLYCSISWAADWKWIGGFTDNNNGQHLAFYDSETVERLHNGNVKAWMKDIKLSEMESIMNQHEDEIAKKAGKKVAEGYVPPYTLVKKSDRDIIDLITWETIANYHGTNTHSKLLIEFACKKRLSRSLYFTIKTDGKTISLNKPDEWTPIQPDSNSETLHKILCNKATK
jgi:hypothetical protein